ncbi:unnamed protein product, partial [Mesorhabditis spiculigera]
MGWDDDVDTLLPTSKKVAHPDEREAYSYYIGQRYLRIEARTLTLIVRFLPTFALVSCIFLALFFHFYEATNTHCHVPNILPSISTVIGGFWETNFIWSWAIYLHALPRLIPAFAYNNVFIPRAPRRGRWTWFLIRLHATLSLVELSALLSLTYYNSDYNHLYHVVSFSIFGSTSLLYALVHLTLCRRLELHVQTKLHMQAWRLKKRAFCLSVSCLLTCFYLFYRHNAYCEPYVFSVFSLFEYSFVLSNILFHSTFRLDFHDRCLYIS